MSQKNKKLINVPKNFFEQNVFEGEVDLPERHEYEQFFWTRDTVERLIQSCQYVTDLCCLTTPSLAHGFHEKGEEKTLLDIDERFEYLPKFKYYDVRVPYKLDETFQIIVLDPPFFVVPIEEFRKAVDVITNKNYNTKIIIGFIKREEKRLMEAFRDYQIKRTNFELKYASIKPNKWRNFALYSNIDLPGIKRQKN
jgi:hypothetical protein